MLVDIQMPLLDGFEVARRIRVTNTKIPVIALTASAMKEDVERAAQAGMNEHLSKPIEVEKLYAVLLRYIRKA